MPAKGSVKSRRRIVSPPEQPKDFVKFVNDQLGPKKKTDAYEKITGGKEYRPNWQNLASIYNQSRLQLMVGEKKLLKVEPQKPNDNLFLPGSYTSYDHRDYTFYQAPKTEQTTIDLWRAVWQDETCVIVSVSQKGDFAKEPTTRCYPYWPKKEGETLTLANGRYVIKCTKRLTEGLDPSKPEAQQRGHVIYELNLQSTDKFIKDEENKKEGEETETVTKEVSLLHYENWSPDKWPDRDDIIHFIFDISKKEKEAVKRAQNAYIPPVLLQGYEAIGRTSVVWVALAIMRHAEQKDGFDVGDVIDKLARQRPGVFRDRLHYTYAYALSFRVAAFTGQFTDWKKICGELKESYEKSALTSTSDALQPN